MLAFCGLLYTGNENILKEMMETLQHRGRHVEFYCGRDLMLAIRCSDASTALSNFDSTGGIIVALDGEIYNKAEIDSILGTQQDSIAGCIRELYKIKGLDFSLFLRGKFSILVWDASKKLLILTRDRLGESTVYYSRFRRGWAFSSELKALLQIEEIPKKICRSALGYYLTLGYVPAPYTILEGFFKVPPASLLVVTRGGKISEKKYWDLNVFPIVGDNLIDLTYDQIVDAVKVRLDDFGKVGILLSGGLDSGCLAAICEKVFKRDVKAFSLVWTEPWYSDESEYIHEIKNYLGIEGEEYVLPQSEVNEDLLRKIIWVYDEPFANPSAIPVFFAFELVRKSNIPIIFSGDGGDEIFIGYKTYYWEEPQVISCISNLPVSLKKSSFLLISKVTDLLLALNNDRNIAKVREFLEKEYASARDPLIRFASRMITACFSPENLSSLCNLNVNPQRFYMEIIGKNKNFDPLKYKDYLQIKYNLVSDAFKINKASQFFGLRLRSPFLDHRLMEFCFNLPNEMKIRGKVTKYILRKILLKQNLLPPRIINSNRKWGFEVPVEYWIRNELSTLVYSHLLHEKTLFNKKYVSMLLSRKDRYSALKIWNLLVFTIWCKMFLTKSSKI